MFFTRQQEKREETGVPNYSTTQYATHLATLVATNTSPFIHRGTSIFFIFSFNSFQSVFFVNIDRKLYGLFYPTQESESLHLSLVGCLNNAF